MRRIYAIVIVIITILTALFLSDMFAGNNKAYKKAMKEKEVLEKQKANLEAEVIRIDKQLSEREERIKSLNDSVLLLSQRYQILNVRFKEVAYENAQKILALDTLNDSQLYSLWSARYGQ